MSENDITRMTLQQARATKSVTDWARVAADPGLPADDFDWSTAVLMPPVNKAPVSIRLDEDVLDYFRKGGKGYQSRINAVLRSDVKAQKAA